MADGGINRWLTSQLPAIQVSKKVESQLAVKASTKLVAGAAVSTDSNGLLKTHPTRPVKYLPVSLDKTVDNSTGAAGKPRVVIRRGVFDFACASATQAWVGQKVYAVDNQTVALAATTTNDILVGRVVDLSVPQRYAWKSRPLYRPHQ